MGLVLAILVLGLTLAIAAVVAFGNMMSDAPTQAGTKVWPVFAVGLPIAVVLALSHWGYIPW